MILSVLARGFIIGFSIAAPVGPIGLLCINRSLTRGFASGFVSGLGAASADGLYGILAASGLVALCRLLVSGQQVISLLGGAFLCYLGIKVFTTSPFSGESPRAAEGSLAGDYLSALALTLTNPVTILSFTAIFAGLGLGSTSKGAVGALSLVLGVFSGSATWWLFLASATSLLRRLISPSLMLWVNRAAGSVLVLFGLTALFRGILH
jgi:threonine/homoserine/homoserine lactone efflux protein